MTKVGYCQLQPLRPALWACLVLDLRSWPNSAGREIAEFRRSRADLLAIFVTVKG
jgi:hypothetical protein